MVSQVNESTSSRCSVCVCLCLCVCRLDVCYSWLYMLRVSRTCPPRMRSLFVPILRFWFVVCGTCFAKRETCCWPRLPPFVVGVPVDGIPSSVRPFVSTRGRDDGRTTGPRRGGGEAATAASPRLPSTNIRIAGPMLSPASRKIGNKKNWNY